MSGNLSVSKRVHPQLHGTVTSLSAAKKAVVRGVTVTMNMNVQQFLSCCSVYWWVWHQVVRKLLINWDSLENVWRNRVHVCWQFAPMFTQIRQNYFLYDTDTNDIAKFLIGQVYLLCRIFRCDFILSCFLATLVDRFSSRNLWTGRWRKILTWKMTSMKTKPRFFGPNLSFSDWNPLTYYIVCTSVIHILMDISWDFYPIITDFVLVTWLSI